MPSASPEEFEPLIGISPDDVEEVRLTVNGKPTAAVFTLGPLPGAVWHRLKSERAVLRQKYIALAISRLKAEGLEPLEDEPGQDEIEELRLASMRKIIGDEAAEAEKVRSAGRLSRLDVALVRDRDFLAALHGLFLEGAAYALRGVRGIVRRGTREPIHFARIGDRIDARTLEYFSVNDDMLSQMWPVIEKMNTLGEAEKKA